MVKFITLFLQTLMLFIIILSYAKINFVDAIFHQSELCQIEDIPCRSGNLENQCSMKYYKLNSTDCRDLSFSSSATQPANDIGIVRLETYHYNLLSYKQTGFNITFSNINWRNLKFRFKQEGNEMKNTCREFHMSFNSTINNLFYDCLWSNETYEGKIFIFEYEMSKNTAVSYKKYYFHVPFAKNIDATTPLESWEIFLYTEVFTNMFGLNTIVLHWMPLPKRFFLNTYNVTIFSNDFNNSEISSVNVTCANTNECSFLYNKWYGSVQFGVQPLTSTSKKCLMSKTVVFHLGGENTFLLLIAIVSATFLIPALVYIFFLIRSYFTNKTITWLYSVPKLLVIFTPSASAHIEVVLALVEYLQNYCHIEPLMDELHIFHSESRDPFKWCNEAINSADIVMVVASPNHKNFKLVNSVYRRTDILLLNLMKEKLSSKSKKIKFFLLMLPYCSEMDIPEQAINLKRFSFPKDINKMLRYINKDNWLLFCLGSDIQGGKNTYKMFGKKLKNSILKAQTNLSKSNFELEKKTYVDDNSRSTTISDYLILESPQEERKKFVMQERIKLMANNTQSAKTIFKEFPGSLDNMNLSGDEMECLVSKSKKNLNAGIVNLDTLNL